MLAMPGKPANAWSADGTFSGPVLIRSARDTAGLKIGLETGVLAQFLKLFEKLVIRAPSDVVTQVTSGWFWRSYR